MGELTFVFSIIILLISISMHEFAHARLSYKLGDPTPKLQNRVTINPLSHIDPVGFLMIFVTSFLFGAGFGRGRPVQANPSYYKNPLRGEFLVAMAGPAMNFILAFGGIFVIFLYSLVNGRSNPPLFPFFLSSVDHVVVSFRQLFAAINIILGVFNLIPLPPLDGYRIIKIIHPPTGYFLQQYTTYIGLGFLLLVVLGPLRGYLHAFILGTGDTIFQIMYGFLRLIFY